ncbi:hypothetical protein ACGYLX_10255 [Sulfitobacter sp. 1A13496]|uniref:hypothetical protein n=1 Tax=Sulfitobacter sp. 1A13496 TaxID=3368596 RepID=UPI003747123F
MVDEREYFERLSDILRRHGFDWVLTQVQAEISEGRTVSKEVSAPSIQSEVDPITTVRRTPQRRRTSLVTTVSLSPREQLEVLIRGIESAIITRAELEHSIFGMTKRVNQIVFIPEESVEEFFSDDRPSHSLERQQIDVADRIKDNLSSTLQKLRAILDAGS